MSRWGDISIFGGSHSKEIGVIIEGLPKGSRIEMDKILTQMSRRAPGQDKTATARKESDIPDIISGLDSTGEILTGETLTALIYNTSQKSKDYESTRHLPRPGHADYPAYIKFGAINDIRGGGHFSGRLTAPMVFAGAIYRQLLERQGIVIGAHVLSVGDVYDNNFDMVNVNSEELNKLNKNYFPVICKKAKEEMYVRIEKIHEEGDSVGGTVECAVTGLPVGLGTHMFGGIENTISSIIFGIPAVKGIEFGLGFSAAGITGSENNDEFYYDGDKVRTRTNNAGGILGGMATGMPLVFKVAIKPTPSIGKEQYTVDLNEKCNTTLSIRGRHDPCIVPRAAPVVEAAAAIALYKLIKSEGLL